MPSIKNESLYIFVTFASTTDAFAMEKACKKAKVEGRLVSVPRQLSAGCGIAWRTTLDSKERLLKLIKQLYLYYEGIHEM